MAHVAMPYLSAVQLHNPACGAACDGTSYCPTVCKELNLSSLLFTHARALAAQQAHRQGQRSYRLQCYQQHRSCWAAWVPLRRPCAFVLRSSRTLRPGGGRGGGDTCPAMLQGAQRRRCWASYVKTQTASAGRPGAVAARRSTLGGPGEWGERAGGEGLLFE
jgi:hypothetical protein